MPDREVPRRLLLRLLKVRRAAAYGKTEEDVMIFVVNSSHYMDWEQGEDEDGNPEVTVTSEETQYLMVGCYTSLNAVARAIVEFCRDFEPDEDEMEGPLEGFSIAVSELDGKIGDGYNLTFLGVFEDEDEVYAELHKAKDEHLERVRKAKAAAGTETGG